MNTNQWGDNSSSPSITGNVFNPDKLIAGDLKRVTENATITGAASYMRGTIMGRIEFGQVTASAKAGGNTGNGTCVPNAVQSLLANAEMGVYTLTCITAAANAATFRLVSPKGTVLSDYNLAGAGTNFTTNDRINALITQGAVNFVVGDQFLLTVPAGSRSYKIATKTAVDGSQTPSRILVDAIDVTNGDLTGGLYSQGEFNTNALIFDATFSLSDIQESFRNSNIFLKTGVQNDTPS